MSIIDKVSEIFNVIARWLAAISTAVMWLVMCYAVIMRYFFKAAPVWGDELCRFCLVWLTFYGGTVALKKRSLANMTLLVNCFPPKVRKWLGIFVGICCVVLLAFFTKWSLQLTLSRSVTIQKTPAMQIPLPIVYSCMPISLALMTLQQAWLVIHDMIDKEPQNEAKNGEELEA